MLRNWFVNTIIGLIILACLSWLSFNIPSLALPVFISVIVVVVAATAYKLEYGVYALLAELAVGSQGYLLSTTAGSFPVSLRLAIFLIVIGLAAVWLVRERTIAILKHPLWPWLVALWTLFVIAIVVGWFYGNDPKTIFLDVNGYLYFGFAIATVQALRTPEQIKRAFTVLAAGVTVLGLQSLGLIFLFSHGTTFQYVLPSIYKWARDLRLAEITLQENNFYRVFFQSHVYVVMLLGYAYAKLWQRWSWRYTGLLGLCVTLIFLSYSRTFWLATLVSLGIFMLYAIWRKAVSWRKLLATLGATVLLGAGGYLIVFGLVNVPLGGDTGSGVSATDLLSERTSDVTGDAGGSARLALLKPLLQADVKHPLLGSGFGSTVTYHSTDKRVLQDHPDGLYTTYAFEWGYLDLWLKLGLAGLAVYLILLLTILRTLDQQQQRNNNTEVLGLGFGVISLSCIHMLTPYLNHPLGIGFICLALAGISVYGTTQR